MNKVLFIDDDENLLHVMGLILEGLGDVQCFSASTDAEAVKILQENDIKVVFEDLNRPKTTTYMFSQICEELKIKHRFLTCEVDSGAQVVNKLDFMRDYENVYTGLVKAA